MFLSQQRFFYLNKDFFDLDLKFLQKLGPDMQLRVLGFTSVSSITTYCNSHKHNSLSFVTSQYNMTHLYMCVPGHKFKNISFQHNSYYTPIRPNFILLFLDMLTQNTFCIGTLH